MSQIASAKALYEIAKIAHELNRVVARSFPDAIVADPWEKIPEPTQLQLVEAVIFYLSNPDVTPAASHNDWLAKNKPTGPLAVPYSQLPQLQRTKDEVFKGIVEGLRTTYDMFYMKALMESDDTDDTSAAIRKQVTESAQAEAVPAPRH